MLASMDSMGVRTPMEIVLAARWQQGLVDRLKMESYGEEQLVLAKDIATEWLKK